MDCNGHLATDRPTHYTVDGKRYDRYISVVGGPNLSEIIVTGAWQASQDTGEVIKPVFADGCTR